MNQEKKYQEVSLILFVDSYDKAVEFYCTKTQLFELKCETDLGGGYKYLILKLINSEQCEFNLNVVLREDETIKRSGVRQIGNFRLSINVDDCQKLYEDYSAQGIVFQDEPLELPYGVQVSMLDPFGNSIGLFEKW